MYPARANARVKYLLPRGYSVVGTNAGALSLRYRTFFFGQLTAEALRNVQLNLDLQDLT